MTYLGSRDGYKATADEVAALPDYREAMKVHGKYTVPPGQYRYLARTEPDRWQIVDVRPNPINKSNIENYSDVRIIRDAILTPLDEEFHFQKY
jgi:hypothetical protein